MDWRGWTAFGAAVCGFIGVALGAFAAHGVQDAHARDLIETGAHYQLIHALAVIAALTLYQWGAKLARFAAPLFLLGVALFSGGLYAQAFGAPRPLAMIIPLGGVSFLMGWLSLAAAALHLRRGG